jgi:hypothetical protein
MSGYNLFLHNICGFCHFILHLIHTFPDRFFTGFGPVFLDLATSRTGLGSGPAKKAPGLGPDRTFKHYPLQWGRLNISQESLDLEAQAAALASYAQKKSSKGQQHGSALRRKHGRDSSPVPPKTNRLPDESRPVAQIALDSYLGTALRNVGRSSNRHESEDDVPSFDSYSSGSDSPTSDVESLSSESDHSKSLAEAQVPSTQQAWMPQKTP